ncbi:SGT1 protein-domain-containing protein [Plectosphaerella plurivora]|uniref:SGT1 protein-domain-containing protein n=1 Tax=Plectosphaerella plurivora TaxID=936078 RepID=A0A9P9A9I9_9PEZI|nr:SGT1 protein-domain-containing protein [Plectosphaerella plurivora]
MEGDVPRQGKADASLPDGPSTGPGDNCVEYMLFLVESSEASKKMHLSRLEELRKEAMFLVQRLASNYIWQRDEFSLALRHDHQLTYLHGVVDFGDSVEDEWLVVYLLRELTLSRPDLWIRVFDGDGEFLLIEAANSTPPWINPEMDTNRPWIHQGQLCIIRPKPGDETSRTALTLGAALSLIRTEKDAMFHSDQIDSEAFYRLEKYPDHITKSLHHALITIPRKVAYILRERPKSIAPAVEAFYLRDGKSLEPILAESSTPWFPPTDLVTTSVTFSRVLFAQVRSQRFDPPPRWAPLINKATDTKAQSQLELGMKLTCGFEMMIGNLSTYDSRVVREVGIILDDLEEDGDEQTLPSDHEMSQWPDATKDDDDSWLDINYEDFERELDGRGSAPADAEAKGFGDVKTQADLRKIVERFESFLDDDTAGVDGAEVDAMDRDDDDDNEASGSDSSDDEDAAVNFDEEAFAQLMREAMGLSTATAGTATDPAAKRSTTSKHADPGDTEELTALTAQFEAELRQHGALKLDNLPAGPAALKDKGKGKGKERATDAVSSDDSDAESEDGEMDIDYNLAKNILESFKSQAGMAGPAGNLLGMFGVQLPRDEDDAGDTPQPSK